MLKLADRIEALAAHPVALLLYLGWCFVAPVFSVDVANYVISVATGGLLFLTLGGSRRDRKAVHIKLDDLETSLDCADSSLAGIEAMAEHEIEAARPKA